MPAYWWECEGCNSTHEFEEACGSRGMAHYIRDALIPSKWDQSRLLLLCPSCDEVKLRIAYEFPREERESIRVIHVVGLGSQEDEYIPMMWETSPFPHEGENWFDFKYINGRNVWGLNKPAVLTRHELATLFHLYGDRTSTGTFP